MCSYLCYHLYCLLAFFKNATAYPALFLHSWPFFPAYQEESVSTCFGLITISSKHKCLVQKSQCLAQHAQWFVLDLFLMFISVYGLIEKFSRIFFSVYALVWNLSRSLSHFIQRYCWVKKSTFFCFLSILQINMINCIDKYYSCFILCLAWWKRPS